MLGSHINDNMMSGNRVHVSQNHHHQPNQGLNTNALYRPVKGESLNLVLLISSQT